MDENKQVKVVEPDLYDSVVNVVAQFTGIFAGVVCRCTTAGITPANDTLIKRVLRESGSIALSTAVMGMTSRSILTIGAYLKPYIVQK